MLGAGAGPVHKMPLFILGVSDKGFSMVFCGAAGKTKYKTRTRRTINRGRDRTKNKEPAVQNSADPPKDSCAASRWSSTCRFPVVLHVQMFDGPAAGARTHADFR